MSNDPKFIRRFSEKMTVLRCVILLAGLLLLCGADAPRERPLSWAQPVINTKIGNLYKVSADVFRAEQPDKSNVEDLKSLNIRTMLNLREYHEDDSFFTQNGLKLIHHKMSAGGAKVADLIETLRLIKNAEKPVLVHCWHGSDRTGLIIAGYRMVFQNWNRKEAIEEFRLGGFGYHEKAYPNILKLLETMDIEAIKKAVLSNP